MLSGSKSTAGTPRQHSRVTAAFSLIEMLCTLTIIIILYVLYLGPSTQRYQRSKQADCRRNLQFIYMALQTYTSENHDLYPSLKTAQSSEAPLSLLVPRWTTSTEHFICPGGGDKAPPSAKPFADYKISYAYAMGLTKQASADQWLMSDSQVNTNRKAAGDALFSEDGKRPGNNHRKFGGNLLFGDGHTDFSPTRAAVAIELPAGVVALNPKR